MSARLGVDVPASMRHLPIFKGLPVPFVAIWEAERVGPGLRYTPTGLRITDRSHLMRRATYGTPRKEMWWLDTPTDRRGNPEFGATHSTRQRACVLTPLCQICGRKQNPKHLLYVVADTGPDSPPQGREQRYEYDESGLIINPPTCEACFRGALHLCPHLVHFSQHALVFKGTPRITGFQGTILNPDSSGSQIYGTFAELPADTKEFIMGRQLMVSLEPGFTTHTAEEFK